MALISHPELFPHLEVLRIKNEQLRLSTTKIRVKLRLPHLKKLDFRGCLVKIDEHFNQLQSKYGGKKVKIDSTYVKNIKKKALAHNYHRVKWQDSPDTSDEEQAHRKYADSSCESDNSDELEHTRKKKYTLRLAQKRAGELPAKTANGIRFDFEKDLLF